MDRSLAIVTGASSGIGAAVARALVEKGFDALVTGRAGDRLEAATRQAEGLSHRFEAIAGDLCDRRFIYEFIGRVGEKIKDYAYVVLVNNAGVGFFGDTFEVPDDHWDAILSTNLTASFLLCREVGRMMAERRQSGLIVNVSSDADLQGFEGAAAYCASKSGLLGLSRALRLEFPKKNIRVTTVSPGRVDTCFNSKKPGMRPGALTAEEVAEVIAFTACSSRNIEIQEIRLDSMGRFS